LFNLEKNSLSYDSFLNSEFFAINMLSEHQFELSKTFAHPVNVSWNNIPHNTEQTGAPILKETIAFIECQKEQVYDGGDHSIFKVG